MKHVKGPVLMKSIMITKQCRGLIIETQRLLRIKINTNQEDQNQHNMPISLALSKEKASGLFSDLKAACAAEL